MVKTFSPSSFECLVISKRLFGITSISIISTILPDIFLDRTKSKSKLIRGATMQSTYKKKTKRILERTNEIDRTTANTAERLINVALW